MRKVNTESPKKKKNMKVTLVSETTPTERNSNKFMKFFR